MPRARSESSASPRSSSGDRPTSSPTGTVSVLADPACAWTAASPDNWITITSGSSGSGDGVVSYTVGVNPAATPRTTTLTIAGQPFMVTQAGTGKRRAAGR